MEPKISEMVVVVVVVVVVGVVVVVVVDVVVLVVRVVVVVVVGGGGGGGGGTKKNIEKPFFGAKAAMLPMGGSRFSWLDLPPTHFFLGFLRGWCSRGGGNWGTLRIPFGKIGEP